MLTFHGANYLMIRTEGDVYVARQNRFADLRHPDAGWPSPLPASGLLPDMPGYVITSVVDPGALPNPLDKTVEIQAGAWLDNFARHPLLWAVPGAGFAGGLLALLFAWTRKPVLAFIGSGVAELGVIGTAGVAMFPFIMPSSSDPRSSLTVWDSVSSHLTLEVMFWAALIFTPIVIAYTGWAYKMMAGKVTTAYVETNDHSAY